MSKEIVRWLPESLDEKIERWKSRSLIAVPHGVPLPANAPWASRLRLTWAPPERAPQLANEFTVDLPRVCAVTKKLWCARYRRRRGERYFSYIRSAIAESRQCLVSYSPEQWRMLPRDFATGIEDCPHCGGHPLDGCSGAVWCDDCRMWCCYGLTSRSGWFICQCGGEGNLVDYLGERTGVVWTGA
jgi:hypothetical protein